jgi:acyl carrier protein phosphodiesterase
VIIDIIYDHMLAANWSEYSDDSLSDYAQGFYASLQANQEILPPRILHMSSHMIRHDWLTSYADPEGIRQVLQGMNRRTEGRGNIDLAIEDMLSNYAGFEEDFSHFFKKLRTFSVENLELLNERFTN